MVKKLSQSTEQDAYPSPLQRATLVTHHFFRPHIFDKNAGIEHSLW